MECIFPMLLIFRKLFDIESLDYPLLIMADFSLRFA